MRIALVLLMIAASGCRSLSLRGEQVRVTQVASDVVGCRFLGESRENPPHVGSVWTKIRNESGAMGADVVYLEFVNVVWIGKAYDCGGRYARR